MSRLLLDTPAAEPGLEFGDYASALAEIVQSNHPNFAIGIFGSWGTGKTTLMNQISRRLDTAMCIPVDFNAWRYEKEPHLIVPLLDTVRESLVNWSGTRPGKMKKLAQSAWRTAVTLGQVVASLTAGVELEAGVPQVGKIKFRASEAMKKAREFAEDESEAREALFPQSLYHLS